MVQIMSKLYCEGITMYRGVIEVTPKDNKFSRFSVIGDIMIKDNIYYVKGSSYPADIVTELGECSIAEIEK